MARREVPTINAGSMADIAFLLLVFFLMVTTIESEVGIPTVLPPPIEEEDPVEVKDRDIFVVKVNMNNALLCENDYIEIDELRARTREFMISNGVFEDLPQDPNLPIKEWIQMSQIDQNIALAKAALDEVDPDATDDDTKKLRSEREKKVEKWEIKKKVYEEFGRYKPMAGSSIISMQNDNGTNYDTYIQVQSELFAAIGELRDELAIKYFGQTYSKLEKDFERAKNDESVSDELKEKVLMIREVYPKRIVEAEPKNVEKY